MKKCPFCGKGYPDDVVRCMIDGELLASGNPPSAATTDESATIPLPSPSPSRPWTERQIRTFELALVCLIAFGTAIFASGHSLFYGIYSRPISGTYGWVYNMLRESMALALLWYVLMRRGKTFADLGLNWTGKDAGWSLLLRLGGSLAYSAVYSALYHTGLTSESHHAASVRVGHLLFGGGFSEAAILFQFLNPFFEELIVRAYVITEIKFLTGSMAKAVMVSTLLQTSYHFYQGTPAAIAHGATFLIFSIYYAKTNRIAPVILAHLYSDVYGALWYRFNYQ